MEKKLNKGAEKETRDGYTKDQWFMLSLLEGPHVEALYEIFAQDLSKTLDCIAEIRAGNKKGMEAMFFRAIPASEKQSDMQIFSEYFEHIHGALPLFRKNSLDWENEVRDIING